MDLLTNPYIYAPVVGLAAAQLIKFARKAYQEKPDRNELFRIGGVINSVTAFVVALIVSAWAADGLDSAGFGLAIILGGFVLYDVLVLHRAIVLNRRAVLNRNQAVIDDSDLTEYELPTLRSVLLGGLLGVVVGFVTTIAEWSDRFEWFFSKPDTGETTIYLIVSSVLAVLSLANLELIRRSSINKLPTSRRIKRAVRYSLVIPSVLALLFSFAQRQDWAVFDDRIWVYACFDWIIIGSVWAYLAVYRSAPGYLREEALHFKQQKKKAKATQKKKTKKKQRK